MSRPWPLLLMAAIGLLGPAIAAPTAGRYSAELCVAVADAAANCGPVDVQVHTAQRLTVRVADLAYLLRLYSSQLDVVTMHGTMQIDGFVAPYEWQGTGQATALQFDDVAKRTRYTLKLNGRRQPS